MQVEDPPLLTEISSLAGFNVRLIRLWRGCFDSMPISVLTTQSLGALVKEVGIELAIERFRPNIVIDAGTSGPAYPEERWIGRRLVLGDGDAAQVRCNRKTLRCRIVNIDPETIAEDRTVHAELISRRKNFLGIYASSEHPGLLRVGQVVRLSED